MQKNTVLTIGLLSLAGFGLTTAQANVKLILDESTPLGMVGNTNYDLSNNTIEITLDRPVLCNKAAGYQVGSLTKLKIYDPNLEMKGGFGGADGIYLDNNADYVVNNGEFFLNTDNPAKALCVSAEVGNYDLIFKTPFETMSATTAQIKYVGLPNIVSPGQVLNYQIEFHNPSAQTIYFDLLEYWNEHFNHAATLTPTDNIRTCNTSSSVQCPTIDPDTGVIKGIQLFANSTFSLDVTQKVSESSSIGAELDFMAAMFLTNGYHGDFLPRAFNEDPFPHDPHLVSQTVTVLDNSLPDLSWVVAPSALTTFNEDDTVAQVFEIRFSDAETPSQNLTVTVTDQLGNIVNTNLGTYVQNGLDGTRTLTVLPITNAFTQQGTPEQITVTVKDAAGGESTLTFDVQVTAINDAPTFALNCAELSINEQNNNMTCTSPITGGGNQIQGVWDGGNIIASSDMGPNEGHQAVQKYEVEVVHNADGILDTMGSGSAVTVDKTSGEVTVHTNNGVYGTAEVRIRLKDNGGVLGPDGCEPISNPEHGCDVSNWETLIIKSEAPVFNFSGVINGLPTNHYVILDLSDAGNNNYPVENNYKYNQNGDDPLIFSFNYDAISQFNYKITITNQTSGYNCDISSVKSTQVDPDNITGTISNQDIDDIVVDCAVIP